MRKIVPWIAVAPWALWALARGAGLDLGHPLVAAVTFTPYVAATSPLPVIVALVARHRAATGVGLAVAVALVATVAPRAIADEQPAANGPRLTVMTSNLFGGRGDARRVVRLVREHRVDVLSLQELTPDAVGRLERAGLREELPHAVLEPRPGGSGAGLYARRALRATGAGTRGEVPMPEALLDGIAVAAVHPLPPIGSSAQYRWRNDLRAIPSAGGSRLRVVAGDFNATLDHRELRRLLDRGYADAAEQVGAGLRPTWPVGRPQPPITIDHVLVDRRIAVEDVSIHDVASSDHRALVARLRLP